MSQYPAFDEYQVAIGLPSRFFSDPEIKARQVVRAANKMPEYSAGRYAITFKFARADGSGPLAVRCFKTEISDLMERYRAIQLFLEKIRSQFFVGFAVSGPDHAARPEGVLINGRWLPVMRMEWVDGRGFGAAVKDRLNQPAALGELRDQLLVYAEQTERFGFAHGDIHSDNIIVTPAGLLQLVDYDGLFVPALRGRESPVAGQADFQSPARMRSQLAFGSWLDRFPLLVIDLTLAALQRDPSIMNRRTPGEGLLLGATDFQDPSASSLLQDMQALPGIAGMVHTFRAACACPLEHVPRLAVLRQAEESGPGRTHTRPVTAPTQVVAGWTNRQMAVGSIAGFVTGAGTALALSAALGTMTFAPWMALLGRSLPKPGQPSAQGSSTVSQSVPPAAKPQAAGNATLFLTKSAVALRVGPGDAFLTTETLPPGTRVRKIFAAQFGWNKVSAELGNGSNARHSIEGYIHDKDLAPAWP